MDKFWTLLVGMILGVLILAIALSAQARTPSELELLRKMVVMQENHINMQDRLIKDYIEKCGVTR